MVPELSAATGRYAIVFLIAAVVFVIIYLVTYFTLKSLTGLFGNEDGYCESVWVHFLVALGGGLLLFYTPQNPVHLEPMIAVMALSVFWSGILVGGIWEPAGRGTWTRIKKWEMTVIPFSLSYALGWFSAVVAAAYLMFEAAQWQGVFSASWDVFTIISDPRVGTALMIPCAYLGASQYVYQIPYIKAGDSVSDALTVTDFYQAAASIYDRLPPDSDVTRRDIETTIAAHTKEKGSFEVAHLVTAETYLEGTVLDQYLANNIPNQKTRTPSYQRALQQAHPEQPPQSNSTPSNEDERGNTTSHLTQSQYDWQHSDVTFTDIGGYYPVKQALFDEVIEPLQATTQGDDRFDRFGIEPKRGLLFYGPPGTGKTLFARALAGELGVPFVELSPADVTSKWINEGPDRVRELFVEAAQLAPCVIFLDEAEHLFGGRDTSARTAHAEDRKITSEFLVQLTQHQSDVIVVSATNRPGDIDPAILRPGRLATHYEVGLPNEETRHAILETKLDEVPSVLTGEDLATLAAHTRGFSGADLEDLVDDARRSAAKRDAEAVALDDFPSIEELNAIAASHEQAASTETLPDPEAPSSMAGADDRDNGHGDDDNDEPSVGYQ